MVSNSNLNYLPPVQENEFLPPISRWITLGGIFIVNAVGIAISLASVTKYNVTVKAEAMVRPTGELRIVQAATEGSIMQISVKENQQLKQGDIIATIDDSRLQTKKSKLQSQIQQAQLQLSQIEAQIHSLDSQILAETDRRNRAVASAKAELSRRQRDYRERQITTRAEVEEAQANLSLSQEELQRATAELKKAQADLRATIASLKAAESKRNRYQPIAKLGALSQDQYEEAQLAVEQLEHGVEAQKATIEAQQESRERLQQAVNAARARLQRFKASLNPSDAEVAIARERIAQEKAAGEATRASLKREQEGLLLQRIQVQKQLARDRQELQQITIELRKTLVTTPVEGTLFKLNLRNPGQTMRLGEEIAQIVPLNAALVVKARVAPQDKSKLALKQTVHMRVSACPYPDYGTLTGKVINISDDTIKPQGNSAPSTTLVSKEQALSPFYEVTIQPDQLMLGHGDRQCSIDLGMEGRVDIISREETVLKFILRKARLISDL